MDYVKVHFKNGRITTAVPFSSLGYYEDGSPYLGWHGNKDNWYAIMYGIGAGKPFWIARLINNAWVTYEKKLGVKKLVFEDGSEYTFPQPKPVKKK